MKNKFLALVVIAMMIITSVSVSAADFSVNMGETIDVAEGTTSIVVPLYISNLPIEGVYEEYNDDGEVINPDDVLYLSLVELHVQYDSSVLTFAGSSAGNMGNGYYKASGTPVVNTLYGKWTKPSTSDFKVVDGTICDVAYLLNGATDSTVAYYDEVSDGIMIKVKFNIVEGTTAESTVVNFGRLEFLDSKGVLYTPTVANGVTVNLPQTTTTKYAVSASANNADYGTVAVSAAEVEEGGKVTVTATPAEGYEVESYSVNGGEAVAVNTNTFEVANITADTTIVVNFKKVVRVTAIKTFDNRLYDNGTLYTGVTISEGDDYAAAPTIKAGINIAKAGTENGVNYWLMDGKAPVSTGNNTSVYVIGLNNVTDTTDITKASASKGVLVVGETTYYGDPVTAIYGE